MEDEKVVRLWWNLLKYSATNFAVDRFDATAIELGHICDQ